MNEASFKRTLDLIARVHEARQAKDDAVQAVIDAAQKYQDATIANLDISITELQAKAIKLLNADQCLTDALAERAALDEKIET